MAVARPVDGLDPRRLPQKKDWPVEHVEVQKRGGFQNVRFGETCILFFAAPAAVPVLSHTLQLASPQFDVGAKQLPMTSNSGIASSK